MARARPRPSPDPTRATRLASYAGAVAIGSWWILFVATTQVASVRAASPFADDPWDAVSSVAAVWLPLVVAATLIRSLRHHGPYLAPPVAARIRGGIGMGLVIVAANLGTDGLAWLASPPPADQPERAALILALLAVTALAATGAAGLLRRAARAAEPWSPDPAEPDLVDELIGLARALPPLRPVAAAASRFMGGSTISPRRHRIRFGLLAAALTGVASAAWHALAEGPWPSLAAAATFGLLAFAAVLSVYLVALEPLRLIRPAR